MASILVTGGCGFIGSNFINYWLHNHPEDNIVNLDKMTYAADESYIDRSLVNGNYRLVKGDIADKGLVFSVTENVDTVVNFAAESHVDNSINDPSLFIKSNYEGVYNILEATRKRDLRFHQVSTDEVYGSLPLDSKDRFSEQSCYNPRNPYSATKAAADLLIKAYYNTHRVRATISNCSNNFGPNQHPEKLIPKTILNALSGKKIPIYGDGNQIRDWIYVEDHVRGIETILDRGEYGSTYLISAENELKNIDLVRKILRLLGIDENMIEFVADRPGHDVRYALSPKMIEEKLGWKAIFKFDNALESTLEYYVASKNTYQNKIAD